MIKQTRKKKLSAALSSETLIEFVHLINVQSDFSEILRLISQQATTLFDAEMVAVLLLNPRTRDTVKTIFKRGLKLTNPKYNSVQRQVNGWMLKHGHSFFTSDIQTDSRFEEAVLNHLDVSSVMGALLRVEGIILGSLILLNKNGGAEFKKADLSFLEKFAVLASPYVRNAQELQSHFEEPIPESTLLKKYEAAGLIGKSENFMEMLHTMEAAARCDVRIMLEGQSGTGKELIARAIHGFSSRNHAPFVAIDCGAIPANLVESELFGYEKGAFTGANKSRVGLIEEADGGVLFMDEIANLPLEMQVKLMRVLQENEIRPVGSNQTRKIDVRFISASSRSLRELVREELFREDLFYRLHVFPIYVPSLKERQSDIALLAARFLERFAALQHKPTLQLHETIIDYMRHQEWSGNIRELENFVERLVALAPPNAKRIEPEVVPADLEQEFKQFLTQRGDWPSLQERLTSYEQEVLRETLAATSWNQSEAARQLHMSEQNLRYRMKKLGITRPT